MLNKLFNKIDDIQFFFDGPEFTKMNKSKLNHFMSQVCWHLLSKPTIHLDRKINKW